MSWYKGEGLRFRSLSLATSNSQQVIDTNGQCASVSLGNIYINQWTLKSNSKFSSVIYRDYLEYGLSNHSTIYGEFLTGNRFEQGDVYYSVGDFQFRQGASLNFPVVSLKLGQNFHLWNKGEKALALGYEVYSSEFIVADDGYRGDKLYYFQVHFEGGVGGENSYLENKWGIRKYGSSNGVAAVHQLKYGMNFQPGFVEIGLNNLINYPYKEQGRLLSAILSSSEANNSMFHDISRVLQRVRHDSFHQLVLNFGVKKDESNALVLSIMQPVANNQSKSKANLSFAWHCYF